MNESPETATITFLQQADTFLQQAELVASSASDDEEPTGGRRSLGLTGEILGEEVFFSLGSGPNAIGSDPSNHAVLRCLGVSRRHALLLVEPKGVQVVDQLSKNGTFANGQRILSAEVEPGDEICFGPARMRLVEAKAGDSELAFDLEPPALETVSRGESNEQIGPPIEAPAPRHRHRLRFPASYVRGVSEPAARMHAEMEPLVTGDLPVLIVGETGVGKEMLARAFHLSSPRSTAPFVAINCAAIPAELLEAELFGVGKGVATGVAARRGKFALAAGGTLFLDEIGEMPAELQAKLLRVLQEKEIQPVGEQPVKIDVRVVSATNADISRRLEDGNFRRDLYYRLAGYVLRVPPLRRCVADVPALVESFLRRFSAEASKPLRGLSVAALRALQAYPWPGNVRELEHEIWRLVHTCPPGQVARSSMLSAEIVQSRGPEGNGDSEPTAAFPADPLPTLNLADLEEQAIREALRHSQGNQTAAARLLGISRFALRRRLERHDL